MGDATPETDVGVWQQRGILENWRTVVVARRFCLRGEAADPDAAKKRGGNEVSLQTNREGG